MSLRAKLLLALAPLAAALLVIGVAGGFLLTRLGRSAQEVLEDNYRSVLACQRMKESAERLDSAALFLVAGRREEAGALWIEHRRRFEEELHAQEGNITEPGEQEATARLRRAWSDYLGEYDQYFPAAPGEGAAEVYFARLLPRFLGVKEAAEAILAMNQDAMVRKSERARRTAERSVTILLLVSAAGFLVALYASTAITTRLLRPLSVLGQATRRIGEGDLAARARVEGRDEIAALAGDFNAMAGQLQKYRQSSLGELLETQRAAQATIDSLPDPVLVLAAEGYFRMVNRAAEELLLASVEGGLAALDPAIREAVERLRAHVVGGRGAYLPKGMDEALRVDTPRGERHFVPRATPVYAEEGDVAATTIVLQDVTRFLRFEELRNNLVATVAHEFRTPLTSLRMAVHLLAEQRVGPLNERQADLVYAAREDGERLQGTVDELLDLSRIQAGRMDLHRRPTGVEVLVRQALEAQAGPAGEGRVALRSEVLPGIGEILVDPERIQLVFANLLSNALRLTPSGGAVAVRARAMEGAVRFEVLDGGPGIPEEYRQAIFEKYFQMPGAPPGGAGLGLFIAKEIVQAHGGEIGVESGPGRGSTFWFSLPRAMGQAPR